MKIFALILVLSLKLFSSPRIAIIGGGMSGVATAAFLKNKHFEIHLFEKEAILGGHVVTLPLPGKGKKAINVDLGSQFINPKGWAIYVDFLKYFNLWDLKNFYKFKQTITIFKEGQELPNFITPGKLGRTFRWLKEKDDSVKRLFSMLRFLRAAHQYQKNPGKKISVSEFLEEKKIDKNLQEEIINPLIATSFTAPIEKVGDLAITTVAGVLAFQSPLKGSYWYVSKSGLAPYIEIIAQRTKISNPNFQIHVLTPVTKVEKNENGSYKVSFEGQSMDFDIVVFSTHIPVLAEILKGYKAFEGIWDVMPYTYNKVIIHTDQTAFMDPKYPAFYNVKVREDKTCAMAMNLQMISPDFGPLIKSWGVTDSEYEKMKREGTLIAETVFMHPLQTISFLGGLRKLKKIGREEGNLYFTGGWSMDFETQFNAVLSGYLAASAIAPEILDYWRKKMPSIKKLDPVFN